MKRIVVLFVLLVLSQFVLADGARGGSPNLVFHVVDGNTSISGAGVRVCLDANYSRGCMTEFSDSGGFASFYIAPVDSSSANYTVDCGFSFIPGWCEMDSVVSGAILGTHNNLPAVDVYYAIGKTNYALFADKTTMALTCNYDTSYGLPSIGGVKPGTPCVSASGEYDLKSLNVDISDPLGLGVFVVRWSDVFPSCIAKNPSGDSFSGVDVLHCFADTAVPNMHLSALANLFGKSFSSVLFIFQPRNFAAVVGSIVNFATGNSDLHLVSAWLFGIVTPLFIAIVLITMSILLPYLYLGLFFGSWNALFLVLLHKNVISARVMMLLIPLGLLLLFVGTVYISGIDAGLWSPLVVF